MNAYIFIFGKHPSLSRKELDVVFGRNNIATTSKLLAANILHVTTPEPLCPKSLMDILGGTVKISEVCDITKKDNLASSIVSVITKEKTDKKIAFAITDITGELSSKRLSQQVKQDLKTHRINSRFSLTKSPTDSALFQQQNFQEIIIISGNKQLLVTRVSAVQDILVWSKRDYDRPSSSPRKGMLPPKVSRIMVNLSLPKSLTKEDRVYDPFCGVGTIVAEALMLGVSAVGSDIKRSQVDKATANLHWLSDNYQPPGTWNIMHLDATQVTKKDISSITSIVTEPYLGPPVIKSSKLNDLIKGIKKQYIGTFKNLSLLLKPASRLVIVVPQYKTIHGVKTIPGLIDTCEKFGYTRIDGPFIYSRPYATVQRAIYILERKRG